MRKLIDEIEKLKGQGYGVNGISRDAAISDCIQIVKSHDPWIPMSKLPPMNEEPEFSNQNESISVLLGDIECGNYEVGYYDFEDNKWRTSSGYKSNYTHWAFLPEVKQ